MLKDLCSLLLITALATSTLFAQNIKDEKIEYSYIKLPSSPLNASLVNYQAVILAPYEADNAKKLAEYEAEKQKAEQEYQAALAAHPAEVAAAEAEYQKQMEEWKSKSIAEKVVERQVLNENNKPVQRFVPEPRLRTVPEPQLKTTYDYPVLANTYLQMGGFNKATENAVIVEVTLYGFDYTQPRQQSLQKNKTVVSNGNTSTVPTNYYFTEFTYRHPMAMKVIAPDGTILINQTPEELNNFKTYKSPETENPPSLNAEQLIKTHEEKILQENLKYINDLVNDQYGYQVMPRTVEINYVKAKDETYQDIQSAFHDASSGLKFLVDNEADATVKLKNSVTLWTAALAESDVSNKKARINEDVTKALYFNLLEGHFALYNWEDGQKAIAEMNKLDLNAKERKLKDEYEALYVDLKKRVLAQNR